MKKESLIRAKTLLMSTLINSDINQQDKLELMVNIYNLLDEMSYESDIKTLQRKRHKDKYDSNNQGRKR